MIEYQNESIGLHDLLEKFYASHTWNSNISISSLSLLFIDEDGLKEKSKNIPVCICVCGGLAFLWDSDGIPSSSLVLVNTMAATLLFADKLEALCRN